MEGLWSQLPAPGVIWVFFGSNFGKASYIRKRAISQVMGWIRKYSQIFKLRNELMGELGLNGTPAATHRGCATGDLPGFARGNHRRPWEGANGTGASPTPSD